VLSAQADSSRASRRPPLITWLDAATLGAGLGGSIALMGVDSRIARRLQGERYQGNDTYRHVADVAGHVNEKSLFAAGVLTYGVAKLVHAPRTTADIAWHTSESIFMASATATIIRGVLGRSRPFVTHDSDAYDYKHGKGISELSYRAYPSIHAASAFATAAALTAETARHSRRAAFVVAPISYSLASLPGLARMYKDKHWASDVAMGAALGAVSGWATVRYHHHRPGNRLDKIFIGATPSAMAGGEMSLVWGFTF
jgi:membrane-associated phospholipid phosphatase